MWLTTGLSQELEIILYLHLKAPCVLPIPMFDVSILNFQNEVTPGIVILRKPSPRGSWLGQTQLSALTSQRETRWERHAENA